MNLTDPKNATHPLVVVYEECRKAVAQAIAAQWVALDTGGLAAFKVAHDEGKRICRLAHVAEQAVYDAGLAYPHYTYVTVQQMDSYAADVVSRLG